MTAGTRRDVGTVGAALIAINGTIGAAVFGLPGKLDAAVGDFAPLLLLLAGLGVACIAICLAELASHFDRSGGPLLYSGAAFGPFIGFQTGWMLYISRVAALAANATVLTAYAAGLWPALGTPGGEAVTIIVTIGLLTLLNLVGVRPAIGALGGLTMLKLVPLVVLAIAGLVLLGPPGVPTLPRFSAIESVALVAVYAFVGFEAATFAAGETRNPQRAVPRALLTTIAGVTLLYVAMQFAYGLSPIRDDATPLAALGEAVAGPVGAVIIGVTAILSIIANQSASLTSTPRMTSSLADDRLLPRWFAVVWPRFATPGNSILFYGALGLGLALSGTFVFLAVISSLARLLAYFVSIAALPRIRAQSERRPGVVLGWIIPLIAAGLCVWAASQSSGAEWRSLALFAAAGTFLYLLAAPRRRMHDRAA